MQMAASLIQALRNLIRTFLTESDDGAVRDIFLVHVEFPGCEITPVLDDGLLQFLYQAGLADTGQSGNEQRTKRSPGDVFVLFKNDLGFLIPAHHFGNEPEPVGQTTLKG